MARRLCIAFLIGSVLGLGVPVAAQQVVRLFGTQSTGTITPVLINSSGYLIVWGT